MKYLLDSNTIIALVQNDDPEVVRRAGECDEGDLVTSAVAFAEVAYGSVHDLPPATERLRAFVEEVPVLAFDRKAALAYTRLPFKRASFDRLIAAHALSIGLTVVTDNMDDFKNIPDLMVETWHS